MIASATKDGRPLFRYIALFLLFSNDISIQSVSLQLVWTGKKPPWCPKFYGPKLQFDTKYDQIVFLVLAVEGGASSRYNIVVSVVWKQIAELK